MGPLKRWALNAALAYLARMFSGQMSEDKVLGIVRHGLTTLGGILVAHGIIEEGMIEPMIGVGMAAFGMVWSFMVKRPT